MGVQQRQICVTGEIENVRLICDFVADFANDMRVGEDVAFQLQLSVEEVCTNIIEHGYHHQGQDKTIVVACLYGDQTLKIRITDEAPLFNPLKLDDPDPGQPLYERGSGGWGIYFVKQYMTSVIYETIAGQNSLLLVKTVA